MLDSTTGKLALLALLSLGVGLWACDRTAQVPRAAPITDFDHEKVFPLATGEHHKNLDCAACHGQFGTFTQFDCLGCHGPSATEAPHVEMAVPGYDYESTACVRCHPTGDCHPGMSCMANPEACAMDPSGTGTTDPMMDPSGSGSTDPMMDPSGAGTMSPMGPSGACTMDPSGVCTMDPSGAGTMDPMDPSVVCTMDPSGVCTMGPSGAGTTSP